MANKTLEQSMYKIKLKERFERVERLPENYQARMVLLADGLLEEAEKERKRNISDCFGCLKDSPKIKPNALTKSAMLEAERIAHDASVKQYGVEEALLELKK